MRSTIICVDDDRWLIDVLSGLLNEWLGRNYAIEKALSGAEALDIVDECIENSEEISLVIADYIMPGMKGDELLEQIKLKTPMTRRIMLTGFAAIEGITNAINKAGIYRFMSKPWDNKDMMLTVLQAIRSYEQDKRADMLAKSHQEMYLKTQELAGKLQTDYMQAIMALSVAAEIREGGLSGHAGRVAKYASDIARELNQPEQSLKKLNKAALLHDVGKLCLNDAELGSLRGGGCYTRKDIALKQAECAKAILANMEKELMQGIIYHTERADGLGPYGLNASNIPIDAKIIGLCNYFDILCTARPNEALKDVLRYLEPDKGKIFDGALYNTLVKVIV